MLRFVDTVLGFITGWGCVKIVVLDICVRKKYFDPHVWRCYINVDVELGNEFISEVCDCLTCTFSPFHVHALTASVWHAQSLPNDGWCCRDIEIHKNVIGVAKIFALWPTAQIVYAVERVLHSAHVCSVSAIVYLSDHILEAVLCVILHRLKPCVKFALVKGLELSDLFLGRSCRDQSENYK